MKSQIYKMEMAGTDGRVGWLIVVVATDTAID